MTSNELWLQLSMEHKYDIIEMLAKAERGEMKGKKIKAKKGKSVFSSDPQVESGVRLFLEEKGVSIEEIT